MSTAAQQLEAKGQNTFHLFQQYLEDKLGPMRTEFEGFKSNSRLTGEDKQALERLQTEIMEIKKRFDDIQIAMNKPGFGANPNEEKNNVAIERKTAFDKMLRFGTINALQAEERKHIQWDMNNGIETKALYAADATTGGFLTTPEYVNQLLKNIVLISDMSDIVDMRTTSNPYIMTPKRTQTASAVRVAEQATRTETQNPKFGLVANYPYEAFAMTLISRTDLDDAELDLGAFIMAEFAEQFAKLQGFEFINGLGSSANQAFGFLNDSTITGTPAVTTATSATISYADLVKLKTALKPGYMPNATWIWTNETLGYIQGLTDTQNRPLWVPFGGTLPDTIFSRPYRIMPDMPQMSVNGGSSGALAVAFGDFKNGYQGVVRKQVSMQVLNERYADQNAVGYFGYYRFGGTTKITEAIKVLKVHV